MSRIGFQSRVKAVLGRPSRAQALPSLIFLLLAIGSLGPSSYFLHFDTPTQDVIAADLLLGGCLGTGGGKPGGSLLLFLIFALAGINPLWETVLLTILGAVGLAALFRLTNFVTGSPRWALLGALWFLSLPTILYYTRTHIGYPLIFFVIGLALQGERRFHWAGVAFGLSLISHSSFVVPIAAWLGWSALFQKEMRRVRNLAKLGVGILLPILFVEAVYFLINGARLGWSLGRVHDWQRLSSAEANSAPWPFTYIIQVIGFSNGWLNAALLILGLLYPAVRKPRVPLMDAIYMAGWSVVAAYSLRVATGNSFLTPRMFAGIYPLLAISSTFTVTRIATQTGGQIPSPAQAILRFAMKGMIALALPLAIINHALDAAATSSTAYNVVDQVMADAAESGLPVRYFGNPHAGRFFARIHNVETVANETSPDVITSDSRAVLIFEGDTASPLSTALRAQGWADKGQYTISIYPHRIRYQPASAEEYGLSPDVLREFRQLSYGREDDVQMTPLEVWWPSNPQGTFVARQVASEYILHYQGDGCLVPKRYYDGTKNYYDIIIDKAREFWIATTTRNRTQLQRAAG